MKTRLHQFFKTRFIWTLFLGFAISQSTFAQGDIYPSTENNFTGGSTVCQNDIAGDLVFDFNTQNCGTSPLSPIDITVTWFSNTVNSTSGGTQVAQYFSNSGVNSFSYTPSTAVAGTLYYYVEVTWGSGSLNCASPGILSSSLTQAVIVNPILPVSVSITAGSTAICTGASVTFTATPVNGGSSPTYQWKVNGINAGTNSPLFTTSSLVNGDVVTVELTSDITPCATGNPATSNAITMTVDPLLPVSVSITASATTICSGTAVTFTATPLNGGISPSYQWKVNGINAGINSPVFTTSSLTNGNTVTVILTSDITSCATGNPATSNSIVMTVTPVPPVVTMSPASASLCQGSIQGLTANSGSVSTFSTGGISVAIPDNTVTGVSNTISVSGIPAGATINNISVTFSINHLNVGDLVVNLRAPNTNVLNLANRDGGTGDNFTNTIVSSTGAVAVSTGTAPFTGTFLPDGIIGVGTTAYTSNVASFPSLYSVPNGNWVFSVRDAAAGTTGTITSWTISISWSYPITWSPITDLFSNAPATIPYTIGQVLSTVYAKPSASGSFVYTATATHPNGCTRSNSVTLTVNPTPSVDALPLTQTICSGDPVTSINISNPNAVPGTSFSWIRDNTINLTGIAASGTSSTVSGSLINNTVVQQTTNFTIIATSGSCSSSANVDVKVNPVPVVNNIANQAYCENQSGAAINFGSNVPGATFTWSSTANIGFGTSGTGNIPAYTAINAPVTATVSVFAAYAGCNGPVKTFTITVNSTPSVAASPLTQTICSGDPVANIIISNPNAVPGTSLSWIRNNTVNLTGIAASGTNTTVSGSLVNSTVVQQTTVFTITAAAASCSSTTTVDVKVNPVPVVNNIANQAYCQNQNGAAINFGSNVAGSAFTWSSTANVGFGTSGTGNIPAYTAINSPVTATVSVFATAAGCSGPVKTFTITVNPLPSVTIVADYCLVPGKVRLTAVPSPAGSYTYLWTNAATTSFIDVDIAGLYGVTITNSNGCVATNSISVATELAVNGNFEAGNVGFTSGYTYDPSANGLFIEGKYAVNNNPNFNHTNFWGIDHTTGTGKMMILNGVVGPTVWQETVPVVPNTTYYFSAWALSMNNVAPFAQLQFSVNGSPIGVSAVLVAGVNNNASNKNWQRFYGTWSSGPLSTATCSIVDLQSSLGGNDFALDDISISTLSPGPLYAYPSVAGGGTTVCQGSTLNLSSNLSGGSSSYSFSWTGPAGFTSNLQNPTIPNAGPANSGTYTVSVTDFYGCVVTASRNITVLPPPADPTPVSSSPSTICLGSSTNLNGTTLNGIQADFTGVFAPVNWTLTNNPALTGGSVNTSGAPTAISITSGNNSVIGNTDYTVTNGPVAGNFTFNWSYSTTDIASRDIPQYSINGGAAVNLPGFNTAGATTQSGTASIAVPANQTFTLRMNTTTGTLGAATVLINNFTAPIPGKISWYTVPTAGVSLGTSNSGTNFAVTPATAGVISYYAEALSANGCTGSGRTQVTVTVNQPSSAATGLQATPNIICNGSSTTLTQTGGTLGTGASWKWYSNNTYTNLVGTGTGATASLSVSPAITTTYYLRIEGTQAPCATANLPGPAAGVTVTVRQPTIAPSLLNASVNPVCAGSSTTLTQTGGTLGTSATWKWYSDAAYTVFVGNGVGATANLAVSPLVTTTYYLRSEGGTAPCAAIVNGPAGVTVTVNQSSAAATGLQATPNIICNGSSTTLTQTGGTLGSGASWKWYSNNTYTTLVGTGTGATASLSVSPAITTTYYLRIEGTQAPCATANLPGPAGGVTVTVRQPTIAPSLLNASVNPVCAGTSTTLTQTGGTLGTGATWKWYSDAAYTVFVGNGVGATASLAVSPLVTTTYYLRSEGGTAPCAAIVNGPAGVTVTVNQVSANPTGVQASPSTICAGNFTTLSLTGGGGGDNQVVAWYTGSCGGTLVGTGNNLMVSPAVTTTYYGRYENGSPCNVNTICLPVTVTVTVNGTWKGVTNNDWDEETNWCGGVPSSSTNVIIPSGTPHDPVITSLAMTNDILITPGATLTINGSTLKINGNVSASANIDAVNGTVEYTGNAVQTIAANTFLGNAVGHLVNNNSAGMVLGGQLDVYGSLTFGANGTSLATNDNLTFKSTLANTAWLGNMTGKIITGKATVERYIPNHSKAWQFLAIPVSGTQTVNEAWQDSATAANQNRYPGYGTMLTSNLPGAVGLGFDVFTAPGPSIKTYNSNTGGYDGIPDTKTTAIYNQKGYMVLVRGDRSVTASNQPATATTMRSKGKLFTPADAPPVTNVPAGKFESVGNPYASAIDYASVTKTGGVQTDFFYMWDPKLTTTTGAGANSAYGLGGFQTFSWNGAGFDVTPGGGSYSGSNRYIESGQSFFVSAPFSNGTVSFTENAKTSGSFNVNRVGNIYNQLRTNLHVITGSNSVLLDGNLVQFDPVFSDVLDEYDAIKLNNSGENLGLLRNGTKLAVERRKEIRSEDTIYLGMGQMRIQQYQFEFIPTGLGRPNLTAWLEDSYLNTSTVLNLYDTNRVQFNIINDPGSYAQDRFRIVFKQLAPVPVTFNGITASRNTDHTVMVKWNVENELNIEKYEIERSFEGRNFNGIITVTPIANNGAGLSYKKTDLGASLQDNFYRVKALSTGGMIQYSPVVKVGPVKTSGSVSIYPTLVENSTVHLFFTNKSPGIYQVRISNNLGQVVKQMNVRVENPEENKKIDLGKQTASGNYQVIITGPEGTKTLNQITIP